MTAAVFSLVALLSLTTSVLAFSLLKTFSPLSETCYYYLTILIMSPSFVLCPLFLLPLQADLCVPRLNEGDQVVLINGRDISDHTHDQVVMFIKASCESHSGELILLVRPNGELFPEWLDPLCHFYLCQIHWMVPKKTLSVIQLNNTKLTHSVLTRSKKDVFLDLNFKIFLFFCLLPVFFSLDATNWDRNCRTKHKCYPIIESTSYY